MQVCVCTPACVCTFVWRPEGSLGCRCDYRYGWEQPHVECGDQKAVLAVLLRSCPSYFLRQGLSLGPGAC